MMASTRLQYYRRIASAYLTSRNSQLTFWHEVPEVNPNATFNELGEYYMPFTSKADYPGPFDSGGIPLLDYHGHIGRQYNPIAIAQYGLGNYNQMRRGDGPRRRERFLGVADWLVANLERNSSGLWVWNHHFDWEYRTPLRAPWYSALAQGQGISLLVRAYAESGKAEYSDAAKRAFAAFHADINDGGVTYRDDVGHLWFEEYIVRPPTHILNGFIWASWGVYDYWLAFGDSAACRLFAEAVTTLAACLPKYDLGFWSLYEQSGTRLQMIASPFYHWLHIVQLHVLFRLTRDETFDRCAERWDGYRRNRFYRTRAMVYKGVFKLCYY